MFCTFSLEYVLLATAACNSSTSQLQKVRRDRQFFNILTWKCAFSTSQFHSKSGPSMQCFVHFDFKMCFSLQRRATFPHRTGKKWSGADVFSAFSLENVLLATTTCNFSTSQLENALLATVVCNFSRSQLQKVVRTCCEQRILIGNALLATVACHFSCFL